MPASVILVKAANDYHFKTGQCDVGETFMFYRVIPCRGKLHLETACVGAKAFQLLSGQKMRPGRQGALLLQFASSAQFPYSFEYFRRKRLKPEPSHVWPQFPLAKCQLKLRQNINRSQGNFVIVSF
jgi:hypothetical protein